MSRSERAFVLHRTRLRPVPGLPEIRLQLGDDVFRLWRDVQTATGDPDAALPYWAFAWGGGLAIGRYLLDRPDLVVGRTVRDVAAGSGLCAIVAARQGARVVTAVDIDSFAAAAIGLNARANGVRVDVVRDDGLRDPLPLGVDVVLAGDCFYDARLADRALPWLRAAADAGALVLVGDPGRRYLPLDALDELAAYEVRTTTELEDLALKRAAVYALR